MASISIRLRISRWLTGTLLVLAAAWAVAGPGFIGSAKVSGDAAHASVEVRFNCKAQYLRHEPAGTGDRVRIYLDPTGICNGVSPVVAESRSRLRPFNSDTANLVDLEYDGDSAIGPVLTLNFSEAVTYEVEMPAVAFGLVVHVHQATQTAVTPVDRPRVSHRQVARPADRNPHYVVNLASFQRIPTNADAKGLQLDKDQRLFYTAIVIDGTTWYRLRLGDFEFERDAVARLAEMKTGFPGAWIDRAGASDGTELATWHSDAPAAPERAATDITQSDTKVEALMEDARKSMASGNISRAVQIYTKVMQMPANARQPKAQEYLALAREKKGQVAHAKAEYRRYLSLYPESEGAARVSQRLEALLATDRKRQAVASTGGQSDSARRSSPSDWRLQTYFSQYYRRDANQQNDEDEVISQSALYSDVNLDARRRGDRFDFSSRISAGYRNDFLGEDRGSDNELRISYAYADLFDAESGLRGRIGRQSRTTGGVLGRFDGINLGYELGEQIQLNAVYGKPAYSASDGIDSARTFYGASVNYGPVFENLEVGAYFIQQDIDGLEDRQAVGTEFRYFGTNMSFWGLIDYDTYFNELGTAFLQGSWRFASRLTLHGSVDRRHSPFLSTGNALIGQPVFEFAELLELYRPEELKQFGLDRSPVSTTYTLGLSHSLTPKLQVNADMNQTEVDPTPESGGVAATSPTSYRYYSTNVIASSLFKEGDVTILGARYSDSNTSRVISLTIDSRYPFGRTWRINPRLRVDRRERMTDASYEWLYTPGIRVQYRRNQKFRIELEAGKQFAKRETATHDLDRESYYINLGYQAFF